MFVRLSLPRERVVCREHAGKNKEEQNTVAFLIGHSCALTSPRSANTYSANNRFSPKVIIYMSRFLVNIFLLKQSVIWVNHMKIAHSNYWHLCEYESEILDCVHFDHQVNFFSEAARRAPEMERREKKKRDGERDEGVYFSAVLEETLISS